MRYVSLVFALCLILAGCATEAQTRAAVTGGALGAAVGASMAADGDQAVAGALIGGAVGAATAEVLSDPHRRAVRRDGNGYGWEGYRHRRRLGDAGDDD